MITIVIIIRQLRLTDHRALQRAMTYGDPIVPVVCHPNLGQTPSFMGWPRMGPWNELFWVQSALDFCQSIMARGGTPIVTTQSPSDIVKQLIRRAMPGRIIMTQEWGTDDARAQANVRHLAHANNIPCETVIDGTLLGHVDEGAPPTSFRKFFDWAMPKVSYSAPKDAPPVMQGWRFPEVLGDPLFGEQAWPESPVGGLTGGETAAVAHLHDYMWESTSVLHYHRTRNQLMGHHASSMLSAALAFGCLSPQMVMHSLDALTQNHGPNDGVEKLRYELMWREFFVSQYRWSYQCGTAGDWFKVGGLAGYRAASRRTDRADEWVNARTGHPFVDANMRQLRATGFMSNRGRQNVASYWVHDLGQDWRYGAAVFDHFLVDANVPNNYGNWMTIAGVRSDAPKKVFNVDSQAARYDPAQTFIKKWGTMPL
jgi:deoxyribodipyrimidine photo-lyase